MMALLHGDAGYNDLEAEVMFVGGLGAVASFCVGRGRVDCSSCLLLVLAG